MVFPWRNLCCFPLPGRLRLDIFDRVLGQDSLAVSLEFDIKLMQSLCQFPQLFHVVHRNRVAPTASSNRLKIFTQQYRLWFHRLNLGTVAGKTRGSLKMQNFPQLLEVWLICLHTSRMDFLQGEFSNHGCAWQSYLSLFIDVKSLGKWTNFEAKHHPCWKGKSSSQPNLHFSCVQNVNFAGCKVRIVDS